MFFIVDYGHYSLCISVHRVLFSVNLFIQGSFCCVLRFQGCTFSLFCISFTALPNLVVLFLAFSLTFFCIFTCTKGHPRTFFPLLFLAFSLTFFCVFTCTNGHPRTFFPFLFLAFSLTFFCIFTCTKWHPRTFFPFFSLDLCFLLLFLVRASCAFRYSFRYDGS